MSEAATVRKRWTIEGVEKSGKLVCARNSGYSQGMFTFWKQSSHLTEKDWLDKTVTIRRRNGRPWTLTVRFYLRASVDRLAAKADSQRALAHWEETEVLVENGDKLLRLKAALKVFGISQATLERWSDPDDEIGVTF